MPVVKVLTLKKDTVPKSDKHSIDTSANPAIIAGLADGKIILKKKLLEKNESYEKKLAKMARAGFSYDICKKILG